MRFRRTEKLDRESGEFVPIEFEHLRLGDTFRLHDPDGKPVGTMIADSDPIPCEPEGNYIINATVVTL